MDIEQPKKYTSTRIVRSIAVVVIITLGYHSLKLVKISQNLDQQIEKAQKEAKAEQQKLEELKLEYETIDSLQNVEKVAREKLGLVKEDEIVFKERY